MYLSTDTFIRYGLNGDMMANTIANAIARNNVFLYGPVKENRRRSNLKSKTFFMVLSVANDLLFFFYTH